VEIVSEAHVKIGVRLGLRDVLASGGVAEGPIALHLVAALVRARRGDREENKEKSDGDLHVEKREWGEAHWLRPSEPSRDVNISTIGPSQKCFIMKPSLLSHNV